MTISKSDACWKEIEAWAKAQIEAGRDELEKAQNEKTTDMIRGGIAQLRELLNLPTGTTKPVMPPSPTY